jgi:hypothetical protein
MTNTGNLLALGGDIRLITDRAQAVNSSRTSFAKSMQ